MEREKKKKYTKPKIIYGKKIETLAVTCDSARSGYAGCMTAVLECARPWD